MTADLPAAVLFDMDGTLVDTEPYWHEAQVELVTSFGGSWTAEEGLALVGTSLLLSAEMLRRRGIPWESQRIIDHLTDRVLDRVREDVPWRPGARELLRELKGAGVPTALVTMSIGRMAREIAAAVPEPGEGAAFDIVVSADDVTHPKPHPEAYLRAAELLGVEPARCVAIEDSPPGLAAAVASGAAAVGVPHVVDLAGGSGYTVWPTLEGRSLGDLASLLRRARGSEFAS
ncbi:MAG: putative hydrolase [Naasia sp.]|uniref:HAD family hydrolase n=1 Tax=Naasia sp. TaxID=2546198 RepID=UPI0026109885|nr:HAD family phosphatase [Naasia sp.]MCU1570556.1 putative hydrolase [Naasia sp.]